MSFYFLRVLYVVMLSLTVPMLVVRAEVWMRGSVAVVAVEGEVDLEEVGGDVMLVDAEALFPKYVSGALKVRTDLQETVLLRTSNRISIYNVGAGYFGIERFEQEVETSMDQGQSRMIFNFRSGWLVVDNRALTEDSQMIVETPLGHMSVKNGWWSMKISYDRRSQVYSFSIECADGVLRFTDNSGENYTLRNGQRLSGVGASGRPSIEVAEMSGEGRDLFEKFEMLNNNLSELEVSETGFQSKMLKMDSQTPRVATVVEDRSDGIVGKRPLLIEYAPQSAPVTPFQADLQPPSGYEADLF